MTRIAVFDRQSLLSRLDDDEDLAGEILAVYLDDAPRQLALLEQALAARAWDQVARQAHTLKGASGNVGGLRVEQAARALEAAARNGSEAELDGLAGILRAAIGELIDAIAGVAAR